MTIADDLTGELPELRRQAESMMTEPCTIRRPAGVGPDPDTGADVQTYQPGNLFQGKCKLVSSQVETLVAESADSSVSVQRLAVHVPATAGPFKIGDVVFAAGLQLRITGLDIATWRTATRMPVEHI